MRDVGGQALGPERGRRERRRHREEDDGAAGRRWRGSAPCSQPGHVDADDGDVGRAARRLHGGGQRDRVAGVGERRRRRRAPAARSASASRSTGTTPIVRAAPARRAAASASEPLLPAPPMTATTGGRPWPTYRATTRAVSAGAPQTSITASASSVGQVVGQPGGDGAAEEDRVARRRAPARCARPSGRGRRRCAAASASATPGWRSGRPAARPSGAAGADLLDGADEHAAGAGDRVVHLAAGSRRSRAPRPGRRRRRRRACRTAAGSCAASRLSRSTRTRTSSARERGVGVQPPGGLRAARRRGSRTRCSPTGDDVHGGRHGDEGTGRKSSGR